MKDIHIKDILKMTVAEFATASENDKWMQSHIWTKAYRLEEERNELLQALVDLEDACTSSQVATIHDAPCRVKARELIAKMKGES